MKKLLLTLSLLAVAGCNEWAEMGAKAEKERLARIERTEERGAMLTDGRIYIGMKDYELAELWGWPGMYCKDRSVSPLGVTEWWRYSYGGEPCINPYPAKYYFCFENEILTYWSEN